MYRIDLKTGETLTLTGKKSHQKIHFIEAQQQTVEITFVNNRDTFVIPENAVITMAGDVAEDHHHPMFIAEGTVSADRQSVIFEVNTRTEEYCQRIHKSNSLCLVDIYIKMPGEQHSNRLVRFSALADARLYIEGAPPAPLSSYYTSNQIDDLMKNISKTKSFNEPSIYIRTLSAGQQAQASVTLAENSDSIDMSFDFAIPSGFNGAPGSQGPAGNNGYTVHPVEYIYFDSVYGTVCYLDADNCIAPLGYQAEPWHKIKLYICSANPAVSGDIVLTCGNNQLTVNVQSTPQLALWELAEPVSGRILIQRNVNDPADTLKDASGNVITALVIDWRSC